MATPTICPKCGAPVAQPAGRFCMACGAALASANAAERVPAQPATPVSAVVVQPSPTAPPYAPSPYAASSYAGLRTIARLFTALGWLSVIIGALTALGGVIIIVQRSFLGGLGVIAGAVITGMLAYLLCRMMAEGISVFLDIEANTRQTAISSQKIATLLEQRPD